MSDVDWSLDDVVNALSQARNGQSEGRDEQRRRERPSSDAIAQIARDLRAVLFPAHYGVSDFSEASLNLFVRRVLEGTLTALEEQVRRSLTYAAGSTQSDPSAARLQARELVALFASRLPQVRTALERDIRAALEGDPAATSRAEVLFCYPGITAITHHRLAHELYLLGVPLVARIVSEIARTLTGIDIHPGAHVGESFFIDHGTGVVVGETTIIGARVRMYQGVTLGARNFPRDAQGSVVKGLARHPILEDDVVIYAGATILGRVTIGRGSVVGGNVWITQDLAPYSRVTQAQSRDDV